ncbi:DNA end-binding protein Ku [Rhizobium petrolearium]|uniref:Non-homologous end joining protein Ku n=2 Tax=Neorhizobium TaxID=1525371 RepID=A0ABV0ME73_9HYPH|nr:Ku protein [Neorhizobium petrolearium]MBP1847380.1 DNA end-binding protein Ku [Neorhizobium petrolearium]MCC2614410.1 Ku protein [Neorhizobium petrolearium]WGI72508.1 Ku protein [Neorhizobium petrolearium]
MVAPRANWKGFIKFGEVAFPVALYTAASTSERIAFHTINKATGNRVRREFVDSETGDAVERDEQVKGFEIEDGRYVVLEPEEVAAAIPQSDKTLRVEAFIPCDEVDDVYFDKSYYLAPDKMGGDAYKLLRDGMRKAKVAAIAKTVLFRRLRTVLIRPHDKGLIASTLNYDYEVRSSEKAFDEMPDLKIEGEMLELAKHIINTKKGEFDPKQFDDRYEEAVAELVKAKIEGRTLPKKKALAASKPSDLLQALRESAGLTAPAKTKRAVAGAKAGKGRQKAARASAPKSRAAGGQPQRRAS